MLEDNEEPDVEDSAEQDPDEHLRYDRRYEVAKRNLKAVINHATEGVLLYPDDCSELGPDDDSDSENEMY